MPSLPARHRQSPASATLKPNSQYTPPTPTRVNCRVESSRIGGVYWTLDHRLPAAGTDDDQPARNQTLYNYWPEKRSKGATSAWPSMVLRGQSGHVVSSVTLPVDSPYAISYWWSIHWNQTFIPNRFEIFGPNIYMLTNMHTNERTNQQTWRIAIPPGGGKNLQCDTI